jgi:hypothetical protein
VAEQVDNFLAQVLANQQRGERPGRPALIAQ